MIRILTALILFCNVANAQLTTRVSTSTNISAPTVYTKLGVDSAIKVAISAYAKTQVPVDTTVNGRLSRIEASVVVLQKENIVPFDVRYFTASNKGVYLNIDSVSKYIKVAVPVVDLSVITSSIGLLDGRVAKVEAGVADGIVRLNSLEGWRTNAINDLKNINTAILTIPKKAVSTSTSTTTTTTTTILQ